ncbi:MAG: TIGR04211 family SH3 domain-containing protein [Natronospirillum sp.]
MNVRKYTPRFFLALVLLGALAAPPVMSQSGNQTRYISDILLVPLRTGPTIEYRIVNAGVRSGTEVTLLETDEEARWSRVRVGQQEGWLPTRHLLDEPIAREQLSQMETELAQIRSEYGQLQSRFDELMEDRMSADDLYAQIETERDTALAEIARITEIAGNALMLDERNEELINRNRVLDNDNDQLRSMNESLEGDTQQWRMIMGGALIVFGLIMGLLLPTLIRRRSGDGWA